MTGQLNLVDKTIDVLLRGQIPLRAKEYAKEKIASIIRISPWPVLRARVVLSQIRHRGTDEHVLAEAVLDVNGRMVRAHIAAPTSREAIDLIQARLRRKLSGLARHDSHCGGRARSHRPPHAHRTPGERELVRRKTYVPAVATVEEAVFDMEMMDYDFQLFTDATSDVDSVAYRDEPAGYRVTRVRQSAEEHEIPDGVAVDGSSAPCLSVAAAICSMDAGDMPFVFFADATTGRGCVLYLRHDGHYGLITAADSP